MALSKEKIQKIRAELEAAIAEVCKRHDLRPSTLGNISYTGDRFTTQKMTFVSLEAVAEVRALKIEDAVGFHFKQGSRVFRIESADPTSMTVIGVTNRGKRYRIAMSQLINMVKL